MFHNWKVDSCHKQNQIKINDVSVGKSSRGGKQGQGMQPSESLCGFVNLYFLRETLGYLIQIDN